MPTLNFPSPDVSNPGDKVYTGDVTWIFSDKGFWYSEVTGEIAPGGASVTISNTPPTDPAPESGDLWWNSSEDSGRMFIYTGSEWTESSPQGAGGEGGGIGEAPNDGQQYARQNQDWSVITGGSGDTYSGASAWGYTTVGGGLISSLNIASMTRTSAGVFEYTFDTPMPNSDYSIVASAYTGNDSAKYINYTDRSETGFTLELRDDSGLTNNAHSFAIFATNAAPPRGGTGADAWCSTSVDGSSPASYNIASVTKGATGIFDYEFSTPMPNDSYTVVVSPAAGAAIARTCGVSNKTQTGFRIEITNLEGNLANESHYVIVHATNATLPSPLTQDDLLFVDGRNASEANQEFEAGINLTGGRYFGSSLQSGKGVFINIPDGTDLDTDNSGLIHVTPNESVVAANVNAAGFYGSARTAMTVPADSTYSVFRAQADKHANGNVYNFYAGGSAPNYFAGPTVLRSAPLRDGDLPFSLQSLVGASNSSADEQGVIQLVAAKPDVTRSLISFFKNSTNADYTTAQFAGKIYVTSGSAPAIRFKSADGSAIGAFSDPREISNVQPIAFNASNVIKLLEPKSFELGGRNQLGFVTTNIAANLAIAAEGSETATTALGTLVTASGETTENIEEPESLPYGDTWTQTTVVNEAQSYDPLQLIPVLTKALQESLDKIETLETRLNDAGIA